ncbi:MAG: 4Fe-4S dicluster domain-containing protein [Gammaproteobacteria bacterium]|nr:4Fe-4S dicluster domain-containing protein [Gammaproteobacteria bacterium]
MQRRNFLQRLIYTATTLAGAALPYGLSRMLAPAQAYEISTHLRPPGALKDDNAFIDACIGCGLCGEVCPPQCILFNWREGGKEVNIPYINPEYRACILCDKCMEVCPTESLTKIPRKEIDMGIAQIDRTACYPWVDRGICGACATVCPLGERAIGFDFANIYRPVVREGCVGCGLCVEICPHPSLPIWIVERSKGTVASHKI